MATGGPGITYVPPIGSIIEHVIWCKQQNQAGLMVRHWVVSASAGTGATLAQIASRFDTDVAPLLKPLLANSAEYRGSTARKIFPLPASAIAYDSTGAGIGARVGKCMAKQVSGIISWGTNRGGRSGRGRNYVPFPCEIDNDVDFTPVATYVANLTNLANSLFSVKFTAGANNSTLVPILYHRETGAFEQLTLSTPKKFWATQRRRGDYGRVNIFPF